MLVGSYYFLRIIRYGSNTHWIHTITVKYKYNLDTEKHKIIVKGTSGFTISNGNYMQRGLCKLVMPFLLGDSEICDEMCQGGQFYTQNCVMLFIDE